MSTLAGASMIIRAFSGWRGSGAGVVDEECQAVRAQQDVASFAALACGVARVGLPAVVSSAEGAGVAGAGLVWAVDLDLRRVRRGRTGVGWSRSTLRLVEVAQGQ